MDIGYRMSEDRRRSWCTDPSSTTRALDPSTRAADHRLPDCDPPPIRFVAPPSVSVHLRTLRFDVTIPTHPSIHPSIHPSRLPSMNARRVKIAESGCARAGVVAAAAAEEEEEEENVHQASTPSRRDAEVAGIHSELRACPCTPTCTDTSRCVFLLNVFSRRYSIVPFSCAASRRWLKHTRPLSHQGQQAMGTAHRPGGPGPRSLVRLG